MGLEPAKSDQHNDALLLNILQDGVPLVVRPWDKIADQLGWTPSQVISQVSDLRDTGFIRYISGVFDPALLGYSTALVAFDANNVKKTLDYSAAVVSAHPGVSHCYARDDDRFNLWFTLAVSPQSSLGLESTVKRLAKNANVKHHLTLPVTQKFKLRVRFNFNAAKSTESCLRDELSIIQPSPDPVEITPLQQCVIHGLQIDLPLISEPFNELGAKVEMDAEELLTCGEELLASGKMRRYAAGINHHAIGVTTNVMVVWDVSDSESQAAGTQAALFPSVTHCYLRPRTSNWPFTLYTMIQTRNLTDAQQIIEQIAGKIASPPRRELWTTAEYKKSRVKFFTDDEANWENS